MFSRQFLATLLSWEVQVDLSHANDGLRNSGT